MQFSTTCSIILAAVLLPICFVSAAQDDERKFVGTKDLKIINTWIPEQCDVKSKIGDRINIKYVIRLPDGTGFAMAATFEFTLGKGEVIEAWDRGLVGMCIGENRKLVVPPSLGYGDNEYDPDKDSDDPNAQRVRIPPNSVLIFDTELLSIE